MQPLPKPEVILTHESDLDGLVAGVLLKRLAKKLFNEDIPLQAFHYHNWRMREMREKSAWVSDFSFEPRLDRPNWVIIDHHPTEAAPKNAQLIHDLTKSASLLVYNLCRAEGLESARLDRLVHLSDVADLFLEKDPSFSEANDYASLVKTYQFWNLHALIEGDIDRLVDHPLLRVMEAKRKIEDPIGVQWSRNNVVAISNEVGFVDTVIGNTNLIVHQLLDEEATKFSVLLTLIRRANGAIVASLRSRNGEAARVAEKLQGGGHPNASGATLPRSVKTIPDALEYLKSILNPIPKKDANLQSLEQLFENIEVTKITT